ncbi:MAG: cysteine peptidase family C39 domain-containing protein [bacterium]
MARKPLKAFRQTPGLCGPASLKILMTHYGKEFTEGEMANLCTATADDGADHSGMMRAAERLGHKPIAMSNASIKDIQWFLDQDVPVIIGWWSDHGEAGDHFSVVYDIEGDIIKMMDPELDAGIREMKIEEFKKVWFDFDGKENVQVKRWMMAIPSVDDDTVKPLLSPQQKNLTK